MKPIRECSICKNKVFSKVELTLIDKDAVTQATTRLLPGWRCVVCGNILIETDDYYTFVSDMEESMSTLYSSVQEVNTNILNREVCNNSKK